MNSAVLTDLLRARGRLVAILLAVLLLLSLGYLAIFPSLEEQLTMFAGDLPDFYKALIGDADFSTPEGYVRSQVLSLTAPLLVSALTISAGAALARSERDRTLMGTLLSPAPRSALVDTHATFTVSVAAAGGVVVLVAIVVGAPLAGASIPVTSAVAAAGHLAALAAAAGTVSLASGAWTASPGAASGAGWAFVGLGFLANSVAALVPEASWLGDVSPWTWYGGGQALSSGLDGRGLGLLVATTIVGVVVARWRFTTRDLQV